MQEKEGDGCFITIHVTFLRVSPKWESKGLVSWSVEGVAKATRWSFYHLSTPGSFLISPEGTGYGVPGSALVDFLPLGICFLPLEGTRKVPGSDFPVGAAFLPPGLVDAALVAERPWIQQGARRRRRLIWSACLGKPHPHHLRKPGVFLPVSVGLPSPVTAGCR